MVTASPSQSHFAHTDRKALEQSALRPSIGAINTEAAKRGRFRRSLSMRAENTRKSVVIARLRSPPRTSPAAQVFTSPRPTTRQRKATRECWTRTQRRPVGHTAAADQDRSTSLYRRRENDSGLRRERPRIGPGRTPGFRNPATIPGNSPVSSP